MSSKKIEGIMLFLVATLILVTISPSVSAFDTYYDKYFIEGTELTASLEVLDVQQFTYYGKNYSMRVLGVYSNFATVRIEKTARDIHMDEETQFKLDDNLDYDISVTLTSTNDRTAILKLELFDKSVPGDEPDPDDDVDNSSDDDSDDADDPPDDDSDDADDPPDDDSDSSDDDTSDDDDSSSSYSSSTTSSDDDSEVKVIDGATTINVSFNFTFTPQSAIGFVLTAIIVVGGVVAYKKSDLTLTKGRRRKKGKKGKRIKRSKFAIWWSKLMRRFRAWLKEIIKKLRVKLGELIAGEKILTKDELRNKQLKNKKKY